jgi:hypothetical protein
MQESCFVIGAQVSISGSAQGKAKVFVVAIR